MKKHRPSGEDDEDFANPARVSLRRWMDEKRARRGSGGYPG